MRISKFKAGFLAVAALLGMGLASCSKDFQGDIDAIQDQINQLQQKFDKGTYVTKIEKTANGFKANSDFDVLATSGN